VRIAGTGERPLDLAGSRLNGFPSSAPSEAGGDAGGSGRIARRGWIRPFVGACLLLSGAKRCLCSSEAVWKRFPSCPSLLFTASAFFLVTPLRCLGGLRSLARPSPLGRSGVNKTRLPRMQLDSFLPSSGGCFFPPAVPSYWMYGSSL